MSFLLMKQILKVPTFATPKDAVPTDHYFSKVQGNHTMATQRETYEDLTFIQECPITKEINDSLCETYSNILEMPFEKASQYVIRELNTLEHLIDASLSPKCKHHIEYLNFWDPKEFEIVIQEMDDAAKDPDESSSSDTETSSDTSQDYTFYQTKK